MDNFDERGPVPPLKFEYRPLTDEEWDETNFEEMETMKRWLESGDPEATPEQIAEAEWFVGAVTSDLREKEKRGEFLWPKGDE